MAAAAAASQPSDHRRRLDQHSEWIRELQKNEASCKQKWANKDREDVARDTRTNARFDALTTQVNDMQAKLETIQTSQAVMNAKFWGILAICTFVSGSLGAVVGSLVQKLVGQ